MNARTLLRKVSGFCSVANSMEADHGASLLWRA
jgi:hypothetical protein